MNITIVKSILKTKGIEYKECFEIVQDFSVNHAIIKVDGKQRYEIKIRANGAISVTAI